jgi:D-alanyl-D-alanine carboxypeptidase (penicillin-binding protein 5/6)
MNQEAEALSLQDTHYINVHGLDDEPGEGNRTTAYDIAQIGRELMRHQHILDWSSTVEAPFRGGAFLLQNTNKLLGHFAGLDGIKTGYTEKAGFCLCASAERNGLRLISVVLGADSNKHRFDETARLLAAGFNSVTPVLLCRKGDEIGGEVPVKGGKPKVVRANAAREITLVVSRPDDRKLKKEFVPAPGLHAPLKAGASVGKLRVTSGDQVLAEVPAVASADVAATGLGAWLRRAFRKG